MTRDAADALDRAMAAGYAEAVLHRPGLAGAHDCADAYGRPLCACRPNLYRAIDAGGLPVEGAEGRVHLVPPGETTEGAADDPEDDRDLYEVRLAHAGAR